MQQDNRVKNQGEILFSKRILSKKRYGVFLETTVFYLFLLEQSYFVSRNRYLSSSPCGRLPLGKGQLQNYSVSTDREDSFRLDSGKFLIKACTSLINTALHSSKLKHYLVQKTESHRGWTIRGDRVRCLCFQSQFVK